MFKTVIYFSYSRFQNVIYLNFPADLRNFFSNYNYASKTYSTMYVPLFKSHGIIYLFEKSKPSLLSNSSTVFTLTSYV